MSDKDAAHLSYGDQPACRPNLSNISNYNLQMFQLEFNIVGGFRYFLELKSQKV